MAINSKTKELVAVGISVASGCKPCTDHHVTIVGNWEEPIWEISA